MKIVNTLLYSILGILLSKFDLGIVQHGPEFVSIVLLVVAIDFTGRLINKGLYHDTK